MRVIPPTNVEDLFDLSTAEVLLPSINEDMLTSTTVPEAPPANAYAGGTTYAAGDQVYVASGTTVRDVYESLQAANTGHTPASSPAWWRYLGRTYAAWSSGTTYGAKDIVLDAASHIEYKSLIAGNLNNDPATDDGSHWLAGPSNRWRMFDIRRNTKTTAPSPLTVVITPNKRVNSIGLTGLLADRAVINVSRGGVTVYSATINLSRRRTLTWSDYFFGTFAYKGAEARFNLPPYTDAITSVQLERASGDVSCGAIVLGKSIYLGEAIHPGQNDAENHSTIEHDEFGDSEMTRRRMVPVLKLQVRMKKANVPAALDARDLLNAIPAFWAAIDDADSGYFEPLLSLGAHTRFIVNMDLPDDALAELEIKEI